MSAHPSALFLDRDGILNEMVYDPTHGLFDSPRRPEQVRAVAGAGAFLCEARARGFFLSVVTNQPGVAKGTLTLAELGAVHARLAELLARDGGRWDELRFCPHHPAAGPGADPAYVRCCDCRKPAPGMLLAALREHGLDAGSSWMIGDGLNDVQAGRAAGCRTILIARLKIEQIERFVELGAEPDDVVPDLRAALDRLPLRA